jgi:hypothetical protein
LSWHRYKEQEEAGRQNALNEKDNCDHNSEDTAVHDCNQLVIYGDNAETQREHDDFAVQKAVVGLEQDSV